MATRVYAHDANLSVDPFLYKLSVARAEELALSGGGEFEIHEFPSGPRRILRLEPPLEQDIFTRGESIGLSALIPFGRVLNPMLAPDKLHYEIPRAGDRTPYARSRRRLIHVSSRSFFSVQILPQTPVPAGLSA